MRIRQHPGPLARLGATALILSLTGCTLTPLPGNSFLGARNLPGVDFPASPSVSSGPSPPAQASATTPAIPQTPSQHPSPITLAMQRAGSHYQQGLLAMRKGDADRAEWEFDAALETLLDMNLSIREPRSLVSARPLPPFPAPDWLGTLATPQQSLTSEVLTAPEAEEPPLEAPALLGPEDMQAVTNPPGDGTAPLPEPDTLKYDFPIVFNDQVKTFINYFQTRKWDVITRAFERASRHLPIMRKIFREKELPEDLLNLAFIESAVNPRAVSRAKAAGIWQFIPSTGRVYGMRTSWWVDERRDPEKSTRGAAEYLRNLYRMFNSWPLALAAYNAGEGAVQRAIDRQRTRDFWKLRLPKETQLFVPAFMAMTVISKEPERYGFSPPPEDPPTTDTVVLAHPTPLKIIAHAARTTVERIQTLNPELLRWSTPPDVRNYRLRIPAGLRDEFQEVLAGIPPEQRAPWVEHRVRKGETPALIAKRYGVDLQVILDMNQLRKRQPLKAGGTILVPAMAIEVGAAADDLPPPAKTAARRPATPQYTIRKGDTLSAVAKAHGVSVEDLRRWNGLSRDARIRPGQTLKTAGALGARTVAAERPRTSQEPRGTQPVPKKYVVKRGDTLWEIAREHGVSAEELRRWNGLSGDAQLRPGQELRTSDSPS
ncbi:MAG TPA: LysM peptidoglycan-binding domain-containing protein [Candidatus Methylomirabilis sp.]|nr:LysM peptidoglycan-binding domain-containing protein [Candidatus Methylomirabilis sp.]HSB82110.1 LysM peptidoglycan-binding domain-containing protein [Candidatus Methylomirabilis sp.]HSC72431.1 LysM peptidoglycan-binding domain-containing protein [Candidatus Methylomirabilis sp.]